MKIAKHLSIIASLFLASSLYVSGIEGLKLTIRCPDVVLSWPSIEGENYIVQFRETLSTNTPWVTLTNCLPAESGTNITTFTHSNRVECPSEEMLGRTNTKKTPPFQPNYPLVMPSDDSRAPVPLGLYPPGIDLTGYVILWPDGSTDEWSAKLAEGWRVIQQAQRNGLEPQGIEDVSEPGVGFYQVVRDGVRIWGVTNIASPLVLSGMVDIPFEAGNADPYSTNLIGTLNCAVLFVDGVKFRGGAALDAPPAYPWHFTMDTAFLENGDHTLQIEVFWFDANGANDGTESLFPNRMSDPVTITVSNAIYYPQWEEAVGEAATNATFFLKTVFADVDWQIDIYDADSNFLQRLTGHTDDGLIEADWNLIDTNSVAHTNADVDAEFNAFVTVEALAVPVTKKTPKKKQLKNDWPAHGMWTIAYLDYFKHFYSDNNDMQGHINTFAITAAKYGGYLLWYPQPGDTNDIGQTYPLRYANPKYTNEVVTTAQILKDNALLKSMLADTNSRNFFYRGHGGAQQIGYVSANELAKVIKHRYRFVLLQACNTADGDLDKAFQINGPGEYDLSYYQKHGHRPATFLGNHGLSAFARGGAEVINGVPYDGRIPWQVPYLYYNFLFYWDADLMGWDVYFAMAQASLDLPAITGWSYEDHPGRRLRLFGYPYLHIDEFNHQADWP